MIGESNVMIEINGGIALITELGLSNKLRNFKLFLSLVELISSAYHSTT